MCGGSAIDSSERPEDQAGPSGTEQVQALTAPDTPDIQVPHATKEWVMARWAPVRCCGSAFPRMGSPQGGRARRSVDTVGRAARLAALVALLSLFIGVANAAATNGRVLILDSMVTGGAASPEAQAATAAGKGVDVVDDAIWSTMTTAQFAEYDALILGDPTCGSVSPAAEASALVWGAAVNGNVIIIGTDPVFHLFQGGGTLTNSGVAFAASDPGKTGAYITLSCQ
jgi:hypothetical protein